MMKKKIFLYHLAAFFTIFVWGITMVSTKTLINEGLDPAEIMLIRFIFAYLFLWVLYPKYRKFSSLREELIFASLGISSGSLYFILENTALVYTTATNVSLICALIPFMTAFLIYIIFKEKTLTAYFYVGSILAFIGTVLVIFNGSFAFDIHPLGDFLAFMSIISWAVYGVLIRFLDNKHDTLLVTRKIFFYSILTILPWFAYMPFDVPLSVLLKPVVFLNLTFLGIIASSLCYYLWTLSMRKLGSVKTNNYVYFTPLITIVTANFFLSEQITFYVVCGTFFILCGLIIADRKILTRNCTNKNAIDIMSNK